jgi:hypothetical protein
MTKTIPILPMPLSFNIVPRKISNKGGRVKVQLAAIVQPLLGLNQGEIVASIKKGKKKFTYSKALKTFISNNSLTKANFRPLETYLVAQIKMARGNLSQTIGSLKTFLDNGLAPSFTVTFAPPTQQNSAS